MTWRLSRRYSSRQASSPHCNLHEVKTADLSMLRQGVGQLMHLGLFSVLRPSGLRKGQRLTPAQTLFCEETTL
ncbi:hypothetical protein JTE90_018565 [Oedothorax gibbosus]|uniref:Uncharacterized protein n=1 Tax=Oedothorax gibbosus TaxID=931172 RepID=A0AAV6U5F5_9ARAC|nr:hypothetical protein JTE90_018565 [Oedothorax gibbosus]